MNLDQAMIHITKRPRPMITPDGKPAPALQYTTPLHAAIAWLCARYNDGTLQVIGYDAQAEGARKKIQTHDKRRGGYEPRSNEMPLRDFVQQTKLEYKTVKRMAEEAQAIFQPNNFYLYVDVKKFYEYWDSQKTKENHRESYINLGTAAAMMGMLPMEVKHLCESGEIIRRGYDHDTNRNYNISVNSIKAYLKKKGEEHGENNSDNS